MNAPKFFITALAAAMAYGIAGPVAHAAGNKVAILMPTQSVEYWALYAKGFQKAAAQAGLNAEIKVTNYDANEQARQVEQTIAQKPDAIVLVPIDASALVPSIRKISQAKIPLVVSNSMPDAQYAKYWNAFTGPDDVGNGAQAARAMIQGFKEKGYGSSGKVVVVNGVMGTPPQVQRYQGFVDTLKKEAPGIEVVGALPGDWDAVKSEAAASALLTQHKDIKGIYAEYDVMMQGVVTAVARIGMDPSKLVLVGHGCDTPGTTVIESGKAYATIDQSPYEDGAYSAKAAAELIKGGSPKKVQYLPNPIATKANLNVCYSKKAS